MFSPTFIHFHPLSSTFIHFQYILIIYSTIQIVTNFGNSLILSPNTSPISSPNFVIPKLFTWFVTKFSDHQICHQIWWQIHHQICHKIPWRSYLIHRITLKNIQFNIQLQIKSKKFIHVWLKIPFGWIFFLLDIPFGWTIPQRFWQGAWGNVKQSYLFEMSKLFKAPKMNGS